MQLNEALLELNNNLNKFKDSIENQDIDNIRQLADKLVKSMFSSIKIFLHQWENISCENLEECINKFFQEGYLPEIHKEPIMKFLENREFVPIELYNSIASIFDVIYYEYRFG